MTGRSGRSGTGSRPYRRNRAAMLARNDICALCGHPGARTADHIIPARLWPRDAAGKPVPGLDGPGNLQPAHGTMGSGRGRQNRCATCGKLCNQAKGSGRRAYRPATRQWL